MRIVSLVIHQALAKPSTSSGADDSKLKNLRLRSHKIKPKPPGTKALNYKLVMHSQTKNHKRNHKIIGLIINSKVHRNGWKVCHIPLHFKRSRAGK
jgi:hypothetical protein